VSEIQQRKLREREAEIIDNIKHPVATVSFSYLKYIREEHFPRSLNKKIEVIELGIDQSNFLKVGHPERRSIIYVGALEARKNVLFMLNVFKKLFELNSAFKLTVIGDGPQRKELVEFASSNRLPVNFMGKIPHQAVLLELPRHGIYLHTSVKESFSYSLLEAKLAGLKTCAYDKLQVPAGFIDVAIETFEVDRWCSGILNIDWKYAPFDAATYTVEKMTSKTLELAG
jgi:glycosyltransferase involved in cell wall biosynthesis